MRPWPGTAIAAVAVFALISGLATPLPTRGQEGTQLDVEAIFPCAGDGEAAQALCAEARGTIMFTCQTCHLFVRIARARFAPEYWAVLIDRHRVRVQGRLSDEQLALLQSYLTENLHPGVALPDLPAGLLEFP